MYARPVEIIDESVFSVINLLIFNDDNIMFKEYTIIMSSCECDEYGNVFYEASCGIPNDCKISMVDITKDLCIRRCKEITR